MWLCVCEKLLFVLFVALQHTHTKTKSKYWEREEEENDDEKTNVCYRWLGWFSVECHSENRKTVYTYTHRILLFHTVQTRMFRCNRFNSSPTLYKYCVCAFAIRRFENLCTRTMSIEQLVEILSNSIRFFEFSLLRFSFFVIFPSRKMCS